jgi:hypothetical protein
MRIAMCLRLHAQHCTPRPGVVRAAALLLLLLQQLPAAGADPAAEIRAVYEAHNPTKLASVPVLHLLHWWHRLSFRRRVPSSAFRSREYLCLIVHASRELF